MLLHLLILQIVTFAILLVVLRQLFYKQLSTALARLQALHEQNIAREGELKKKIDEVEAQRKEVLRKAQEESEKIIFEATISAAKVTSDMEEQTEGRAAEILRQGQAELVRKENELLALQHVHAVEQAVKLVNAAFSPGEKDVLHEFFLDELILEVSGLDKETFVVPSQTVKIESAYPVDDVKRQKLVRILSEKMGTAVAIDFAIMPEIIAGLIISIGALTIDGSLRNKLNKSAGHLKTHG